jgi:branched-chain amino acid transport system substrate-binding protein
MVMNFRITKYRVLVLSGVVAIALGGAVVGSIQWLRMQRQLVEQTGSTSTKLSPTLDIAGMSMGDKLMFQGDRLPLKLQGIAAYRRGDYAAAQRFFLQSWNEEARDPESLIYFNNARVSQKPAAVTLAVVISLGDENDAQWSKEILRGVAQAQKQFVDQGNALRIVIGDDGKDPQRAAQLAQQWVDLPEVLG